MEPTADGAADSLAEVARRDSGLTAAYRALDRLLAAYNLQDATLVVDVPVLGRQVLRAGRRPLHNDGRRLHAAPPGLYADPEVDDPLAADLVLALGALALRHDLLAAGTDRPPESAL